MKVTKIHRGIKFDTQQWINSYIEYYTQQRHIFTNDETKKAFFKSMNLTVYGKTIENPAKRSDIRLYTDIGKARQVAGKPIRIDWRLFSKNLICIQMRKEKVLINKPFQLGFTILEWSKFLMYRTYAQLKDHFNKRMRMMYTDTDSMFLYIESPDAYAEIRDTQNIRELFDLFEVPEAHPCPGFSSTNDINADKVRFFKDEAKGNPIIEFVALKPKMYSFTTCKPTLYHEGVASPEIKEKRVVKGLSRAISSKLTH